MYSCICLLTHVHFCYLRSEIRGPKLCSLLDLVYDVKPVHSLLKQMSSHCITSSQTLGVGSLFNLRYSGGCGVVSHCDFNSDVHEY